MKFNLKKFSSILLIAVILIGSFSLSSCKKEAPELPPENAFVLSDMDSTSNKNLDTKGLNAFTAFVHVGVWTVLTTGAMIVPVTAYTKALEQEPVHVSGSKWVWEYQFDIGLKIYTVQLYGETKNDEVKWEMYVSLEGDFQDYLWYTGTHDVECTEGQWIINKSPSQDHQFLQIDWTRNKEDNTGTIKYTNIEPESADNGAYVHYGDGQEGSFDAFYNIYYVKKDNLVEVNYNSTYNNGRIKDFETFEDNNWHCWDENWQDITCPDVPVK